MSCGAWHPLLPSLECRWAHLETCLDEKGHCLQLIPWFKDIEHDVVSVAPEVGVKVGTHCSVQ